jgi:hypothetical protein
VTQVDATRWLDQLPTSQRQAVNRLLEENDPLTAAGLWLTASIPANISPMSPWRQAPPFVLKELVGELRNVICTGEGYGEERKVAVAALTHARTTAVGAIAIVLSTHVGIAAAIVTPVVGLALMFTQQFVGKTICEGLSLAIAELESRDGG